MGNPGRLPTSSSPEPDQRADLNGDGDTSDTIAHLHDAATGLTRNTGLSGAAMFLGGSALFVFVHETSQGCDLNGDGDLLDEVVHVYDIASQQTTNLGMAAHSFIPSDPPFVSVSDRAFSFTAPESDQGDTDLNGDGDTLDQVVHVYDTQRSQLLNLGLAIAHVPTVTAT